ncbi:MAG: hypothetical protein KDD62_14980, partial [Bdellovibrionales bacterium]|nr:hypothetical protein [Bdellovibrionales bacterium]
TANLARRNPFFGDNLQRYEFDEKMLQAIATKSNGFYFNASDLAGLEKVYSEIDALEKKDIETLEKVHVEELYTPFLVIALLCYLVYLALSQAVFMVVP